MLGYGYGHGSWVPIAIFAGMFAIRYVTSQRRRAGRQGRPTSHRSFTGPPTPGAQKHPDGSPAGPGPTQTGTAPGWFRDPFFKHEHRYWSGSEWTEHVNDDGAPGVDPPPKATGTSSEG
jgi:hypothetical protein